MRIIRSFGYLMLCAVGLIPSLASEAHADVEFFPYIDTHAHMEFRGARRISSVAAGVQAMIGEMDRLKIDKTILMPLPQGIGTDVRLPFDYEELLPVLQSQPDRIRLLAGPGILGPIYFGKSPGALTDEDRRFFKAKAEQIAKLPFISGFGEFGIVHLSIPMMGDLHPYEAVDADHPLLLLLAEVAAAHKLPIDVHFDLVPDDMSLPVYLINPNALDPNPRELKKNQDAFERLLKHNREAKIVWAHVGLEPLQSRTVEICRDLLKRHPNLYMSFRLQGGNSNAARFPAAALSQSGGLKSDWANLIKEFPDRFVVGSDTFYTDKADRRGGNEEGRLNLHRLLTQLPPETARMVAQGNVYRIYRMQIQIPPIATGQGNSAKSTGVMTGAADAASSPAIKGFAIDFKSSDLNQDGEIAVDEFVKGRHRAFLEKDVTGQGYLAREVFFSTLPPQMPPPQKMMAFKKTDTDADGKISAEEFDARSRQVFQSLDKRGTGRLIQSDLE